MANDAPDLKSWIGRTEERHQPISPEIMAAMAATLDLQAPPSWGQPLPPGWHWLFFNAGARRSQLGDDGHPKRGGFMPPVALPRRMWAGSRIDYKAPLAIGAQATRVSRILNLEQKEGRSGPLVFLTIQHTICADSLECIVEEQDIVYREPAVASTAASDTTTAPKQTVPPAGRLEYVGTDPVLLFRYSALTFNSHRIHYDQAYARDVEGYPGLVVHGPLTATLLQGFAATLRAKRRMAAFEFRAMQPLFAGDTITLHAMKEEADCLSLQALTPAGSPAMRATARFDAAAD